MRVNKIIKRKVKSGSKKGQVPLPMVLAAAALILLIAGIVAAADAISDNGNGIYNMFYEDVKSGTDIAPGCDPKEYIIEFEGTLDLINQKESRWTLDYKIDLIDVHISDIMIGQSKLGVFSNKFDSSICLYDVLSGGDEWIKHQIDCVDLAGVVKKGHIEKFPFTFKYNLYDNDCNGLVDDHTFNLIAELATEDGFENLEKTVAIVNGEAIFQNVKY